MKNYLPYIVFSKHDNVGIVLIPNEMQENSHNINGILISLKTEVPFGHKFALSKIKKGEPILKYGQVVGIAKHDLLPGDYVHVEQIEYLSDKNQFIVESKDVVWQEQIPLPSTFQGYERADKRVGTRNYIAVVAPVNCSASVVKKVVRAFEKCENSKNIDGVVPITYDGGCAQAFDSKSHNVICETLAGWIDHPNVVASVIIGLGCETVNAESILNKIDILKHKNIRHFTIQEIGGSQKAIQYGIDKVAELIDKMPYFKRTEVSVEHLILGLNCGGSDAFSGLTANPALGVVSDILVSKSGTAILAETPECNGAEQYMLSRCVHQEDKDKLEEIVAWWKKYTEFNHVQLNDNLSKGNMEGGISTILEKSMGAIAKAGHSPIQQVLNYAERMVRKGLLFMDTPGFDPISVTGLVAAGCNMVIFTTGRGSMFSTAIVPTIKVSTNTEMNNRLLDDMDLDAGVILNGVSIETVAIELYKKMIAVANGEKTKGEEQQMGTEEFVPWQFGEIL